MFGPAVKKAQAIALTLATFGGAAKENRDDYMATVSPAPASAPSLLDQDPKPGQKAEKPTLKIDSLFGPTGSLSTTMKDIGFGMEEIDSRMRSVSRIAQIQMYKDRGIVTDETAGAISSALRGAIVQEDGTVKAGGPALSTLVQTWRQKVDALINSPFYRASSAEEGKVIEPQLKPFLEKIPGQRLLDALRSFTVEAPREEAGVVRIPRNGMKATQAAITLLEKDVNSAEGKVKAFEALLMTARDLAMAEQSILVKGEPQLRVAQALEKLGPDKVLSGEQLVDALGGGRRAKLTSLPLVPDIDLIRESGRNEGGVVVGGGRGVNSSNPAFILERAQSRIAAQFKEIGEIFSQN